MPLNKETKPNQIYKGKGRGESNIREAELIIETQIRKLIFSLTSPPYPSVRENVIYDNYCPAGNK